MNLLKKDNKFILLSKYFFKIFFIKNSIQKIRIYNIILEILFLVY